MMKVVLFRLSVMGRNRILQRRHCRCTCAQSGSVIAAVFERVKMLLFPQQNCHGDGVVTGEWVLTGWGGSCCVVRFRQGCCHLRGANAALTLRAK
jgi:hypothetical protein